MLVITPLPAMRMKCDEEKMTAIDDLKTVLKETGVYAHYEGFDNRFIKGALLALHTIATDSLATWEAQVDLMSQSYHTLSVAYNATCKRLEAAEEILAKHGCTWVDGDYCWNTDAALAGEKP